MVSGGERTNVVKLLRRMGAWQRATWPMYLYEESRTAYARSPAASFPVCALAWRIRQPGSRTSTMSRGRLVSQAPHSTRGH